MNRLSLATLALLLLSKIGVAQIVDTVYFDKDARVLINVGDTNWANTNYGTSDGFHAGAWTNSNNAVTQRSIFELDLSHIPQSAVITDVKLYVFGRGNHNPLSGSNASDIYQVRGFSWDESTITWNTHLAITDTVLVASLEASDAGGVNDPDKDYVVDFTDQIQTNWDSGWYSTSFLYRLNNEMRFRRLNFYSSDASLSADLPYVVVKYFMPENYYRPTSTLDGGIARIEEGELNLIVDERYATSASDTLNLVIKDKANYSFYSPPGLPLVTGTNKYRIDLSSSGVSFVEGEHYICVLTDRRGRKTYLRFRYQN